MLKELYAKNQLFFLVAGIAATGLLIWYFSPIVICILVAGVIMMIGQPMVEWLNRRRVGRFRIPNGLSVTLTLSLMVLFFVGMLAFIIPLIVKEINMIRAINPDQVVSYFKDELVQLQEFLIQYGILAQDDTIVSYLKDSLLRVMNVNLITNLLSNVFSVAGQVFFYFFTTLFLAFFFLLKVGMLRNFIIIVFPEKYEQKVRNILYSSKKLLSRYFVGLTAEITALSAMVSVGLMIIGVDGAVPIGFFAGLMNVIPYVGYAIATLLGLILGVTGVLSTGAFTAITPVVIKILAVFIIANMIDNSLLQPFFFGKSVKASPVEIFLVIVASGFIGGVMGMIVAVPAYTFLRIVAREFFSEFRIVRELTNKF